MRRAHLPDVILICESVSKCRFGKETTLVGHIEHHMEDTGRMEVMVGPSNRVRIVVATKPVDFRKGHDGLAALVKNELRKEPFTGTVFVFRAKRADRLKLLYWDGTGLVMAYKRLEETTLACDPRWSDVVEPCSV